jgi:parallel beta-helix repeat protein
MNGKTKIWYKIIPVILLLSINLIPVSALPPEVIYNEGSNTCTVYPSGGDDTLNIQTAFDMISSEKKGRVRLVAGEYILSDEIVVVNFDGIFTGAGQSKTILKTTDTKIWPHRDVTNFPEVASVFLFYQDDMEERSIKISDMTVEIYATTYDYGGFFGLNVFDIYGCVDGIVNYDETPLSTELKDVKVVGIPDVRWPFTNVVNTFQVGGEPSISGGWNFEPIIGSHVVKNCYFDTVGASVKYNSVNGKIQVKNNVIKDNLVGIWLYFCDTVDVPKREIKNNLIFGSFWDGISIWGSNSFIIKNNEIHHCDIGINMWGSDNNLVQKNILYDNALDLSWDEIGDNTWKNNQYDTKNW